MIKKEITKPSYLMCNNVNGIVPKSDIKSRKLLLLLLLYYCYDDDDEHFTCCSESFNHCNKIN